MKTINHEQERLVQARQGTELWKQWGPYLSERQWGTVREDYSAHGSAWEYLPHDQARSKAYRWGEDGLLGISDEEQNLCFSIALWNGRDPILKERLFGLTNSQGNHGEDVKELYYYLDATPTHSYLKGLYKYPQTEFPYTRLIEENARRGKDQPEFELLDTGIFDEDRYFDVFVEYTKASPDDILIKITAHNRGPDQATLHLLPQLWFRNTWSWKDGGKKPSMHAENGKVVAEVSDKINYHAVFEDQPELLFCENETNRHRLYGIEEPGYFKDAFHNYVIHGQSAAVNPEQLGTKAAGHYLLSIPAAGSKTIRVRLTRDGVSQQWKDFDQLFISRVKEADQFYADLQRDIHDEDARLVQRQAFAGMIWSKQFYYFDIPEWIKGDPTQPAPPAERLHGRNAEWSHLNNADIISMPDKWEYPWYAAWDLAFHCIPFALIDAEFAKQQLLLLTREWYMHPNGQLPAYEWAFGDVNPPVHAWATWRVFQIDRKQRGDAGDLAFLERVFHKLMLNFTWWVNRKDAQGRNIFQGGFLGLDNIGVFDRSSPLPTGGFINQADGTSWMAMYCLNLMRIALELAMHNHVYEDIATKFFEHFLHIAEAMTNIGGDGEGKSLWDEDDQFFYDQLNLPDGKKVKLKVRSMVGLIPLFAVEVLDPECLAKLPDFTRRLKWFLKYRPDLAKLVSHWQEPGRGDRRLLSLLRGHRMKQLLKRMLDETEFLSEYGVRALSAEHREKPYTFWVNGSPLTVSYQPAESESGLFGGNSNWRGPIWFPVNYLIIESLQRFHYYYGDDFKIECPTGSGRYLTIDDVANELTKRLSKLFLRNDQGHRPLFGEQTKLQHDRHFRDYLFFPEYFHGDTGRGVGAMHQTGWTGLIAKLLMPRQCEAKADQLVLHQRPLDNKSVAPSAALVT
ncbi:MAG TPA: glucosidase [Gemmatales bacterium]|nr:glucosidase [Gemmatales bacterium]